MGVCLQRCGIACVQVKRQMIPGGLIIAIVILIPLFLLVPFLLAGGVPVLLLFFPALRSGRLLHAWIQPRRLSAFPGLRTALLRRGWGGHPNVFVSPLRRLRTRGAWRIRLAWRRTLHVLLSEITLFRRIPSVFTSGRGLLYTFLIALLVLLPHNGVTRLVAVTLLLNLMLLFNLAGIALT